MSRSGYNDDNTDSWQFICSRGAVKSAIHGKRGQNFLSELLSALDTMPNKRLIKNDLEVGGEFCTLGVIGSQRGLDMQNWESAYSEFIAKKLHIADALVREIVYMNDEWFTCNTELPEQRWHRMRAYIASLIINNRC